ncbi:MAG: hypothetical protein WBZ29_12075 [Methanocella sp.]
MIVTLHAKYARAVIVGAVFSLPTLFCIWLAGLLRNRAVADALSKGQGVLCVGLDIYLLFLLLIVAIFAVAGIVSVKLAIKSVNGPGQAGKTGGMAGAVAVIASIIIIIAVEAYYQIIVEHNFSWPASLAANAYAIIALSLYCLVPVLVGASISAFSGVLYYRLRHRVRPES